MNFDDLVIGHLDWIARTALCVCRSKEDAEDLAQETLLRIFANRVRYDAGRDFKPWAKTIMMNLFLSGQSRRSRRPDSSTLYDTDVESASRTDDAVCFRDLLRIIHRSASKSMCVDCVLLYAKGYSYTEIADKIGIKEGTVKSRIASGRHLIGKMISDNF